MLAAPLLSRLSALAQALQTAVFTDESDGAGPLHQARMFLFAHLPDQVPLPDWVAGLQDQLALDPSPHALWQWEHERAVVLEGLLHLEQYWL